MEKFLRCLVNDVGGFLEGSKFIDASLPNLHVFIQNNASISDNMLKLVKN